MLPREFIWFLKHPEIGVKYAGEYIAIMEEAIVAHGKDFKKVLNEAERYGKEPFIHKVLPLDKDLIV